MTSQAGKHARISRSGTRRFGSKPPLAARYRTLRNRPLSVRNNSSRSLLKARLQKCHRRREPGAAPCRVLTHRRLNNNLLIRSLGLS